MCLALGRRSNSEQGGASVHTERTHPSGSAVRARRRPKRTPKQGRAGGRPPAAAGWYFKMAKVQRWRASQEVSECRPRTIMRDRSAPLTARPSSPPGAPPPHPSPLLPLRPSPRLRHRHWRGSSWRLESPRSTSPCRRTAAAGSATRSPAPHPPPPPPTERPPPAESRKKISRDGRPAGRTRRR